MSTYWLRTQLRRAQGVTLEDDNAILTIHFGERTESVYCPNPDEYLISADVATKAKELGATIIAYGQWCTPSFEATQYAKNFGVNIMRYGALFAYLKGHGVTI